MIWERLKFFRRSEFPEDPEKMSVVILFVLDLLRELLKAVIVIHYGWATSGHSTNSKHYDGEAVDFHVVGMSLVAAAVAMLNILKTFNIKYGFGFYYPEASNGWSKCGGGFHLDCGSREQTVFWTCRKEGEYTYYHDLNTFIKAISL